MNHKIKILLLFVILILSGCNTKTAHSYISYTQTKQENDKLISSVYYYDMKNKPQKIYEFEYNSGYPLGVYDKQNESVFFTQKQNNQNGFYKYDVKNKQVSLLTTQTSAINDIIPIKNNQLFITSYDAEQSNNIIYPFVYNLSNNSLKKLNLEPLISITDAKYDYNSDTILFSGWLREDEEKILQQNEGYNFPLQRYIYAYHFDSNKLELIYKGDSQFNSFGVDFKNNLLFVENKEGKIINVNYKSKKITDSSYKDSYPLIFVEDSNYYFLAKNLYHYEKEKPVPISELSQNQETVNNAIYISQ